MKPTILARALHEIYGPFGESLHGSYLRPRRGITSVFQIPAVALRRELSMRGFQVRLPESIKRAMYAELYGANPAQA